MIPYELPDELKTELEKVFDGCVFKKPKKTDTDIETVEDPTAEEMVKLNIFTHSLPLKVPSYDNPGSDDPYPYIIVRIDQGSSVINKTHDVKIRLIIGIYDDGSDMQGYRDVINIIQKIFERFTKSPVLARKFTMLNDEQHPFSWVLQDDDTYPYYFGAIEATWATRTMVREDEYS